MRNEIEYTGCMERMCTHCQALLAQDTKADWCPACGGSLMERPALPLSEPKVAPAEVDHRGIVLPRRHAVGGIITPQ
ncbi:MAG: hypothetical protein WBQ95_09990 [Terracidiphilus sp.]